MNQQDHILEAQFLQFINAIKSGDIQKVEQLIKKSNPQIVNKLDSSFNQPPIYSAALAKTDELSAQMIKLLIRHGANYRFKDSLEQTVLFYVFRQGKELCAQILLSQGLNIEEADSNGQTPIFYAVGQNRIEIVRKYATKDRVNHVDNLAGQTPIYYAARHGHLQMCKLLMEKGADITHTDHNNKTAVDFAKKSKYFEVSQYLTSQLKRTKQSHKFSMPSHSIEESNLQKKKKKEELKPIRQTYKIVYLDQKGVSRDLTEEQVRQMGRDHPELQKYLANPESIPQDLIDRSNGDLWEKIAMKILAQCFKLKGSYWFQQAVDPVKFNILDYFDIIRNPMDLGTVRKKVMHNSYRNVQEFVSDMKLIWQNCYKYNGETHEISRSAKELQTNFLEYCRSYGLEKYTNEVHNEIRH